MKSKLIISLIILFFSVSFSKAQQVTLDKAAAFYFTQAQTDTMSQAFIKSQNYIVRYSWNIYRRWDKFHDTIVTFNRDTVDIRPYLKERKKNKPTYIYNAYPGLVIVLDSREAVNKRISRYYTEP